MTLIRPDSLNPMEAWLDMDSFSQPWACDLVRYALKLERIARAVIEFKCPTCGGSGNALGPKRPDQYNEMVQPLVKELASRPCPTCTPLMSALEGINEMKYRKKPVVIDAVQWNGDNIMEISEFMSPVAPIYMSGFKNADEIIGIDTLEGRHVANKGDWIIRGIKGEFYPCKPDIFEATYEALEGLGK